jgi:hypothetical protein
MGNPMSGAKGLGIVAALVVIAALITWRFRRTWGDHDVSDPGVTL